MALPFLHTQANIIRWLLIGLGIGVDPDISPQGTWPIYSTSEPDTPDAVITIFNTTGQMDGRSMFGEEYEHYGFQMRVREVRSDLCGAKAHSIAERVAREDVSMVGVSIAATNQAAAASYVVCAINRKGPV